MTAGGRRKRALLPLGISMGDINVELGDGVRSFVVNYAGAVGSGFVSVSKPVSGLQFTISTTGTPSIVQGLYGDYVSTALNTYLVLVFVITNITFSGIFMQVIGGPISGISNIIASDIDGNRIEDVEITY